MINEEKFEQQTKQIVEKVLAEAIETGDFTCANKLEKIMALNKKHEAEIDAIINGKN